ncbi:hypothetical protein, partial [Aurantimonas aggregata]|uniref:hypothetical protein n=1 Tax=Aurantimonas aggregata TaxID=2047720 RepID=UPI001945A1AD
MKQHSKGYDERLFSGGFRKAVHEGRFHWLRKQTEGMSGSVLELGCFNARSLEYLSFVPSRYLGLDAGWEGGLTQAKTLYPQYDFLESTDPSDVKGQWDLGIALETLARIMHQGAPDSPVGRWRHCRVGVAHAFRARSRWRRGSGCSGFEVAVSGRAGATAGAVVRLAP